MKRRSKILIGLAAAAITYLSLLQIAGPRHVGYGTFRAHGGNRHMPCERFYKGDANKPTPAAPRSEEPFQPNSQNNTF